MRSTTLRALATSTLLVTSGSLAACGGGGGDDGGEDPIELEGGTIEIEGCGYSVTTRQYATPPVVPETPALGAAPAPYHLHLGFGGSDPSTQMALLWRTDVDTTATTIQYAVGETTTLDREATGVTFQYQNVDGGREMLRMHEVHLCGLEPDTTYSYRVGGAVDGVESWSPVYQFRTAPAADAADAEIRVGVVGDSRGGYDVWANVAEQMSTEAIDVLLFTGDAVTFGNVQAEWEDFLGGPAGSSHPGLVEMLATTPMVLVHGNHEVNSINFYSQFAHPLDETTFSFDYGPMHVTVLNDTPIGGTATITTELRDFLEADLAASDRPFKILTHHRSMWSSSTNHGSDTTLQTAWGPAIDEHHVDLVVSGHDHLYERSKPLLGSTPVASTAEGTVFLISGGAGADLYNIVDPLPEHSAFAESTYGFAILSIRADGLSGQAFRPGETEPFDTFSIDKTPPPP